MGCVQMKVDSNDHNLNPQVKSQKNNQLRPKTISSTKPQKKLTIPQAYYISIQDPYNSESNPLGYIVYGVSINKRVMPKALEYLPDFLSIKDLNYGNFGGNNDFNQFVAKLSNVYSKNQTMSAHNLSCVIDLFSCKYQKISLQGQMTTINLKSISSYSDSEVTDKQISKCHIIFVSKQKEQQIFQKVKYTQKVTLLVLKSHKLLRKIQNENVFICYQIQLNKNVSFSSVHCSNPKKLQQMMSLFNLHSISTLTQAAAISNIQPNQQQNLQQSEKNFKSQVIQMIKNVNSVQIRSENLHFFIGATSALAFVGKVFFKKGDTVSMDTPVYPGVHGDFQSRVSLKYVNEDIFKSTLLRRVTRAKQDGSKGYVILNANNPTGYVYSEKQIRQVCEWAANNQDFMIIFDEMYVNLIHGGIKTCSSAQYARNLPNIQTIRGFAKQFGLCGFKVAYLVTSNQEAIKSYQKWKDLLVPHPYSLWTVSNMMKRSFHGQQILSAGLSMAEQAIATTCAELDRYSIKYLKPKAGVFVFIDLRDYLKQNIHLNEYLLFKKIFFEYKVNVACGSDYKTLEPGWFRICTVIDEQSIKEGIRRIGLLLKNQPLT